jgi:hypothetical protein
MLGMDFCTNCEYFYFKSEESDTFKLARETTTTTVKY